MLPIYLNQIFKNKTNYFTSPQMNNHLFNWTSLRLSVVTAQNEQYHSFNRIHSLNRMGSNGVNEGSGVMAYSGPRCSWLYGAVWTEREGCQSHRSEIFERRNQQGRSCICPSSSSLLTGVHLKGNRFSYNHRLDRQT